MSSYLHSFPGEDVDPDRALDIAREAPPRTDRHRPRRPGGPMITLAQHLAAHGVAGRGARAGSPFG